MAATAQMVHLTALEMGRGPGADINRKPSTGPGSDMTTPGRQLPR